LLAFTFLLLAARRKSIQGWTSSLIVSLLALDLISAGYRLNPTAPKELFTKTPQIALMIKSQLGEQRLYRDEVPQVYHLRAPSNEVVWQNVWDLQVLNYYTAALYDIPLIFHKELDAMAQKSEVEMKDVIDSVPWERRLPLLSAGAVSLVLTDSSVTTPGLRLLGRLYNASNIPFFLYRNENAAQRVEFVSHVISVATHEGALKQMLQPGYDPRLVTILETTEPVVQTSCGEAVIEKLESRANKSTFLIETECAGYLVFSEPYFPGWRASIDGKATKTFRANYLFSAIKVGPGKHKIQRVYSPLSVWTGAVTTLLFLGVIVAAIFVKQRQFAVA
jgi:hypothetical protein